MHCAKYTVDPGQFGLLETPVRPPPPPFHFILGVLNPGWGEDGSASDHTRRHGLTFGKLLPSPILEECQMRFWKSEGKIGMDASDQMRKRWLLDKLQQEGGRDEF